VALSAFAAARRAAPRLLLLLLIVGRAAIDRYLLAAGRAAQTRSSLGRM